MWRYIARRLLWAVFLFLAVTFVTYVIFFVAPNDPAKLAAGKAANTEQVKQVAAYLHLDEPVWKQYLLWLKQLVFEQSLGRSFVNRQDVNDVIAAAAPVTASLVFGGAILWLLVSIPDRRSLGAPATLAARPRRDDLRADRDLRPSRLDRADPVVRLRVRSWD